MKYSLKPFAMWQLFKRSFKKNLTIILDEQNSRKVMKKAKKDYKYIVSMIDPFDKKDRFIINILSAATLAAILRSVDNTYSVDKIRIYYRESMGNKVMRLFAKLDRTYTKKGQLSMKKSADLSEKITNPYSWRFKYQPGFSVNQFSAYFDKCGICYLMKKLNLEKYTKALCAFDYEMNAMSDTIFTREYTLASGGPYCDCHYNHQKK